MKAKKTKQRGGPVMTFRVKTKAEKAAVKRMARAAGENTTDFIREKIGLDKAPEVKA